jgi:hypothetical protein
VTFGAQISVFPERRLSLILSGMRTPDRDDELIGPDAAPPPLCDLPSREEDPELEREFQELAQWLLDVYLWRLQEERKTRAGPKIDNDPPLFTM